MKSTGFFATVLLSAALLATSWAGADGDAGKGKGKEGKGKGEQRRDSGGQAAPLPIPLDPVYQKECGSCHLAFPVRMLPRRSWEKMLGELGHHFGEDATLPEGELQQVRTYALANAGESSPSRLAQRLSASVPPEATPLRLSEVPYFVREHRGAAKHVNPAGPVKSLSDCQACHPRADAGSFAEDAVRIPKAAPAN
ncbi:MAG: hypothetical protein HQL59_06050 [Magnetococcales bacterium]|nr:hypothetical protein [Magnetococcales bacterium]